MPRVTIDWLEGRKAEQRDQVAEGITKAVVEAVGVRPDQVTIVFNEHSPLFQYKAGKPYQPVK